ncbi:hypothetical protein [Paenibacillus kandeliae]|uniref:hypothetical protein n=1 Tax=Paenibacillus kandeliae TaxID=3231269 RepID=UPI003459C183
MKRKTKRVQAFRSKSYMYAAPMTAVMLTSVLLTTSLCLPSSLLNPVHAAATTSSATTSTEKQTVSAATAQQSYNLFVQRLQKPSTLGLARATLVNRIQQFDTNRASMAVLQLENAYNTHFAYAEDLIYRESVQDALMRKYKWGMTMRQAVSLMSNAADRQAMQMLADMGYRLETSEGIFYPIIDYPAFSPFFAFIRPDIRDYIQIMSAEAKQPTTSDAGIIIAPTDLVQRGLAKEAFLNKYAVSNRRAAVEQEYRLSQYYIFYGSDNTPIFDSQTLEIDPQFYQEYRKLLNNYSAQQIKGSKILTNLSDLMKLVEQSGGKSTNAVDQFLEKRVGTLF